MKGKISGVSLGPGEPELITLKALKALQEADIIYCPGTQTKSRSRDILQALPINMERVRLFHVPMSKDRTLANQTYDSICTEIAALVATGKNIAITAEGDSGFYSSVNQEEKLVVLPGIITAEELDSLLTSSHVVVIMKLSQCTSEIHRFMQINRQHEFHYYENVGTINELHSTNYEDIIQKDYPYFSLMIIRPGKQLA